MVAKEFANSRLEEPALGVTRTQNELAALIRLDLEEKVLELRIVKDPAPERGPFHGRKVPFGNWYTEDADAIWFIEFRFRRSFAVILLLTFGCALLPGLAAFWVWRGPHVAVDSHSEPPDLSLPEVAVLRDGAVGSTRWAFAAVIVRLARDGHCTLVRTRKRRWLRTGPAVTVNLHADPRRLSAFEQTALRQFGRHDTLGGFGFAGSTFRRRTLRDVRADLVERGWLADRHRRSNTCLALGLVLLGVSVFGLTGEMSLFASAAGAGLGVGSLIAASVRYPLTRDGARRRAAHRAYAEERRDRVHALLSDCPEEAVAVPWDPLPALVLERIGTPGWLRAVAVRFAAAGEKHDDGAPDWIRDEVDGTESVADACRTIAFALERAGAHTTLAERLRPGLLGGRSRSE